MSGIQHGKRITTESYYEGTLASTKQEIELPMFIAKETLLKEYLDALSVISSGQTKKLTIEVCIDSKDRYRLTKKWVI